MTVFVSDKAADNTVVIAIAVILVCVAVTVVIVVSVLIYRLQSGKQVQEISLFPAISILCNVILRHKSRAVAGKPCEAV